MNAHKLILAFMASDRCPKLSGKAQAAFFGTVGVGGESTAGLNSEAFARYVGRIHSPAALIACFQAAAKADYQSTRRVVDAINSDTQLMTQAATPNTGVGVLINQIDSVTVSTIAVSERDGGVGGKGPEQMSDVDKDSLADKIRHVMYDFGFCCPEDLLELKDVLSADSDALAYVIGRMKEGRI